MPFDDTEGGGGGGHQPGDPGHDPETFKQISDASAAQLALNIQANGVCSFHCTMYTIDHMLGAVLGAMEEAIKADDTEGVAESMTETADMLKHHANNLKTLWEQLS